MCLREYLLDCKTEILKIITRAVWRQNHGINRTCFKMAFRKYLAVTYLPWSKTSDIILAHDYSQSNCFHGISQAKILEWVAISSSQPRDRTRISRNYYPLHLTRRDTWGTKKCTGLRSFQQPVTQQRIYLTLNFSRSMLAHAWQTFPRLSPLPPQPELPPHLSASLHLMDNHTRPTCKP